MELLNLIFRLGVVFAIFAFIWFFISLGLKLLLGAGRERALKEVYLLKAIQYFFLVTITFLICLNQTYSGLDVNSQLMFGGIILIMYFLGKLQNGQKKMQMIRFYTNGLPSRFGNTFDYKYEIGLIIFSMLTFGIFYKNPEFANLPIIIPIKDAILNIEDTPIFGFFFKVIGFFFMVNIIMKLVNTFILLFSGRLFKSQQDSSHFQERKDDDFDDYTEIKDELNS